MGKTKARQANKVAFEAIPRPLQSVLVLHADLFFVEGEGYLETVSTPLYMLMITYLGTTRSAKVILQALKSQIAAYQLENFTVSALLVDGEGGILRIREDIAAMGIKVDATGAGEHVPLAEVFIRVVKERARSILHTLPYNLPHILFKHLISYAVMCVNCTPHSQSTTGIPAFEAFRGRKINVAKDFRAAFGDYCMVAKPNLGVDKSLVTVARVEPALY
eukprot:gene32692-55211_t